jgi:hypothetical protein
MTFLGNDEILRILHAFNPWWTGRQPPVPPFRRIAFDACRERLLDPSIRRGVLLAGPRRVGKSTVLHQLASLLIQKTGDPRRVVYLSLDHPFLKMLNLMDILTIYETQIQKADADVYLLLDEVQYSKDWDLFLKFLIDQRPELRIVATGSAALKQRHDSIDSGVGRWVTVPMPTLSFYEFLQIRGAETPDIREDLRLHHLAELPPGDKDDLARRFKVTLPEFQRYLLVGGFPETAQSPDIDYCQRLIREDVVERVLKRDMVALFNIRKVNELERLFIYLCFHSGGVLSVRSCASEIGTTAPTVAAYLECLENANLVYQLPPAQLGGKKLLREQSKYYLVDAALRNAVLLRGEEVLTDPDELGIIVETAVLRHLFAYSYLDSPRVAYWRDSKTHKEVDVIVKSPKYTIPVEVKYRSRADIQATDGLVKYSSAEKSVSHAYLVTREDKDFVTVRFPDHPVEYLKVPAHIFIYLLGHAEHRIWERKGRKAPA